MAMDKHLGLQLASLLVHGLFLTATLVVCWLGWLRHRHPGYLVLLAWDCGSLFLLATSWLLPSLLGRIAPAASSGQNQYWFILGLNLIGFVLNSSLLLLGLALLVFRKPRLEADRPVSSIP